MLWQAIQLGHLGMSIPVACILHVSQHIDNTDYARYWQDICTVDWSKEVGIRGAFAQPLRMQTIL